MGYTPHYSIYLCQKRQGLNWLYCKWNLSFQSEDLKRDTPFAKPSCLGWCFFFSILICWNISAALLLSLPGPGNAVLIKSPNNMGRCWRLMPIDNPNCQRVRHRGEFNNLRRWLPKSVVSFSVVSFMYLFPTQGEFWRGPLLGQVRFHFSSSFCRWRSGGGRNGDPNHDVSTSPAMVKRSPRTWVLLRKRPGIFPGSLKWKHFTLWDNVSSSVKWKCVTCTTNRTVYW